MLGNESAGGQPQRLRELLGLAVVGCLFVASAILSWRKWPDAQIDFGLQLYLPWQISKGSILYSGVKYLTGGPLSQYFNAGLFKLFGVSLLTLALSNLVLAALWLVLLYRRFLAASDVWTATLICSGIVLVFAFGQDADIGNYNYVTPYCHEVWHGLLLSTVAIVCASRWLEHGRWGSAAGAGFCTGLVFMTKPEVFAALAAATAAALVMFWFARRHIGVTPVSAGASSDPASHDPHHHLSRKELFKSAAAYLAAGLAPVLAFFLCFLRVESWRESLRSVSFAWVPLLESAAAHNAYYAWCMGFDAPLQHIKDALSQFGVIALGLAVCALVFRVKADSPVKRIGLIAFAALLVAMASKYNWSDCGQSLPLLGLVTCLLLARGLASKRSGQGTWFPLVWSLFGFFLLGKLGLFSRIWHYGFVLAMPAFAAAVYLLVWLLPVLVEKLFFNRRFFRVAIGLVLVVGFLRLFAQTQYIYRHKILAVGEGRDRILTYPGMLNPVDPIIASANAWLQTNTPSTSTLAVLPEGAMVNFLSRRANPTEYLVWNPVELEFFGESAMTKAFQQNCPDYVIFLPRDVSEFGVKPFGQEKGFGLELTQWIHKNYEPVCRLDGAGDGRSDFGLIFKHR